MGVDYATLIVPYSEATPPANTAAKRTPEGQKAWLLKRGIPESVVDDAMTAVYTELAAGRVFEAKDGNPAGYWLGIFWRQRGRRFAAGKWRGCQSTTTRKWRGIYLARGKIGQLTSGSGRQGRYLSQSPRTSCGCRYTRLRFAWRL